jgi:hypothetical protein
MEMNDDFFLISQVRTSDFEDTYKSLLIYGLFWSSPLWILIYVIQAEVPGSLTNQKNVENY